MTHIKKLRQAGFNLIEVLIAVALLGVVILAITTLFFMGRSNVYSGKQMTRGIAVGTRVLEDLSAMSVTDLVSNFNLNDGSVGTNTWIDGTSYPSSVLLTITPTSTYTTTTDPNGYLTRWRDLLGSANFSQGQLKVLLVTRSPVAVANPLTTAQTVQIRGAVQWNEARRQRSMTFDTSKLNRQ